MEVREPARRKADGSVAVIFPVPARVFLFGPFLRLAKGDYRVTFQCRIVVAAPGEQPLMGIEIIAQNRVLRAWRDFNAAELRSGDRSIEFSVPDELCAESDADAAFEFRFAHFGRAIFAVTDVTLQQIHRGESASQRALSPMTWRLLGRLQTVPSSAPLRLSPLSITRLKSGRTAAALKLPAGRYEAEVRCVVRHALKRSARALEVNVRTEDGLPLGSAIFSADELGRRRASFSFDIPVDLSLDAGASRNIDFRFRHFANATLAITAFDLRWLGTDPDRAMAAPVCKAAGTAPHSQKRMVIFGNCQANLIAEAMRDSPAFSRLFSIKHHFMELQPNLHEQGRRDLESCDLLLIQDIKEWDQYPLRDSVPDHVPSLRFPCVRFASPWPFDAFNGPDDRLARNRDLPNFEFTYFDGLLGRLRNEMPDREQRFQTYRSLDIPGLIDVRRLHQFEERRLEAMDKAFSCEIGAYILDRFRTQQIFYTTAHPNGKILSMLMRQLGRELGIRQWPWFSGSLDSLRRLQVPVHPKVAAALAITWASDSTKYLVRGEAVTWEQYVRRYIEHYG